MQQKLLLASTSPSRAYLLKKAHIPFTIIHQDADELACDWGLPLEQLVQHIAQFKMAHAMIPEEYQSEVVYVLTADTLSQDAQGVIHGKPVNREDAIAKIKAQRGKRIRTATAFCLHKKSYNGVWHTLHEQTEVVAAECLFDVPDQWIEGYLANSLAERAAGALAIEDFGMQFVKEVTGSYTGILGLPLFEVRQALESVDFFRQN